MAIKNKISRDTYRSNVKKRPLEQNGLEAQYQGLDITEVNIDHAGLAIIGRGGFQTRRDIRKVRKQYVVDVPAEEHLPTAEIIFEQDAGSPFISVYNMNIATALTSTPETFRITPQSGSPVTFEFATGGANGRTLGNGNTAVDITGNTHSMRSLLLATTGSIEAAFPEDTFSFTVFPKGSKEALEDGTTKYVEEDKIRIIANNVINTGTTLNLAIANTSSYSFIDVTTNEFSDQKEQHEWRLNGYHKDNSNERMFYEDIRVDTIQSVAPHSVRRSGSLFRPAQFPGGYANNAGHNARSNYDANIGSKGVAGIGGDPTTLDRFTTHDSAEILIRQYPKREEILGTHKDYFKWHEDPHYVLPDQQTWSLMTMYAEMYGSTLTDQITRMFEQIYVSDQYVDETPMSGRVDVFERLSRTFDLHPMQTYERHRYSIFTQYLDPIDDFVNLRENRFPKEDCSNGDVAFEDVRGARVKLTTDTGVKGKFNIQFTGEPINNDFIKLNIGDGYLNDFTLKIEFNTGGNHDSAVQAVGSNFDAIDLEIDVNQTSGAEAVIDHIVTKLNDTAATPVNRCSFARYVVSKIGSDTLTFDSANEGTAYDITVNSMLSDTGVIRPTVVTKGVDSLWARDNSMVFIDYFDQEPLDSHDYIEEERYTRIDDAMLEVITKNRKPDGAAEAYGSRSYLIDRREWQQSAYVHTATGFINSQVSGQDGIIYREMKR